jgi:DNA-binding NtrC family response regulator
VYGLERALIEEVMLECSDVQVTAARRLGINRNTLHKKWEVYKVDSAASASEPPEAPPEEASAS